jgi:hypothetical protein
MKLSDIQFVLPDTTVDAVAEAVRTKSLYRFIVYRVADAVLECRVENAERHWMMGDKPEQILGGGYAGMERNGVLFVGSESTQFNAVPVQVCRLLAKEMRRGLLQRNIEISDTQVNREGEYPLHSFWDEVDLNQ